MSGVGKVQAPPGSARLAQGGGPPGRVSVLAAVMVKAMGKCMDENAAS